MNTLLKKNLLVLLLMVLVSSKVTSQAESEKVIRKHPLIIGETHNFYSEVLRKNRDLNIYLPYGYSPDSAKTYPVVYLLDGSMDEDFLHVAGLVQFGSFSWINMLPESIVVGIANVDRKRDFTYPSNNKQDNDELPTSGGSEKFIQFVENELQPFIDKTFKTNETKTIIGQSLGGLLVTEILFEKAHLFDNFVIVSPSLWWDNESLLKVKSVGNLKNKKVFIAVGKEGEIMERVARELKEKLAPFYTESKENLGFEYFPELDHGDTLHQALYSAFNFLFAKLE